MQLSVRDVARILQVPESSIRKWIASDKLPARRIAGQFRFNRSELFEWAAVRKLPITPEILLETESQRLGNGFSQALQSGGLLRGVQGSDKKAVLRSVVTQMTVPEGFDRDVLLNLFLTRESIGSTAVGDGIAIPHPRYPVVLPMDAPTITVCYLAQSIEFDAFDKRPVDTLFVIVAPTVRDHLKMLTHLASSLRDEKFRACVQSKAELDEIIRTAPVFEAASHRASGRPLQESEDSSANLADVAEGDIP